MKLISYEQHLELWKQDENANTMQQLTIGSRNWKQWSCFKLAFKLSEPDSTDHWTPMLGGVYEGKGWSGGSAPRLDIEPDLCQASALCWWHGVPVILISIQPP